MTTPPQQNDQPAVNAEKGTPTAVEILAEIAERVKASNPAVRENYVANRVSSEISDRVALLDKGIQKRQELVGELRKAERPEQAYDVTGAVVSTFYTKDAVAAIKKAREALQRVDNAIEKAIVDGDYSKLKEACK